MKYLKALIDPASISQYYKKNYETDGTFTCTLLYTGVNDYYLITEKKEKKVLRVSLPEIYYIKGKETLVYEAEWLDYIKDTVSVIHPLSLQSDEWVGSIEAVDGYRFCTLFSYAEGKYIRKPQKEEIEKFAKNLALMHRESENFHSTVKEPRRDKKLFTEDNISYFRNYHNHQGNKLTEKILAKAHNYSQYLDTLGNLPSSDAVWGDAHLGNCLYTTDKVTFLDLDFCGLGIKIFDVATYLWGFKLKKDKEFEKKKELFLQAYESILELTETEKNALEVVMLLRNIDTIVFELNFNQRYLGSYARNERFWNEWMETIEQMEKDFKLFEEKN